MSDDLLDRLDDYVRGKKRDDDDAYEEELFTRALAGTAKELVAFDSLAASLRDLAGRGTLPNFTTAAEVERLRQTLGDRAAFVEPDTARESLSKSAELLIIKVPLDLADIERVDVESVDQSVGTVKTMPDVVFEKGADALYLCCEMSLAQRAGSVGPVLTRFWGYRAGEKRLLLESDWAPTLL
jgi:hypothetical protein